MISQFYWVIRTVNVEFRSSVLSSLSVTRDISKQECGRSVGLCLISVVSKTVCPFFSKSKKCDFLRFLSCCTHSLKYWKWCHLTMLHLHIQHFLIHGVYSYHTVYMWTNYKKITTVPIDFLWHHSTSITNWNQAYKHTNLSDTSATDGQQLKYYCCTTQHRTTMLHLS